VGGEALLVLVVALAFTVELHHLADSDWGRVLLYNSDSLTFPLLWKSLAAGQAFRPVLSSQLLAFPEGLLYVVAQVVAGSYRGAIVLDTYLMMLTCYAGLRAVAAAVVPGSVARRRAAAVTASLALIVTMLLERAPHINTTSVITPLVFSTYYGGVIIIGLFAIAWTARELRRPTVHPVSLVVVTVVVAATTISDPLYVIQVGVPFVVVLGAAVLLGLTPLRRAAWLVAPQAAGVALYEATRPLLRALIGSGTGRYVRFSRMGLARHRVDAELHAVLLNRGTAAKAEVALVVVAWVLGVATAVALTRRARREADTWTAAAAVVALFAVVASLLTAPLVVLTGNYYSRYFLPVVAYPFLAVLPAFALRWPAPRLHAVPASGARAVLSRDGLLAAGAALLVACGAFGVVSGPGAAALLRARGRPTGEDCLEATFEGRDASGVGEYWTVRALDLYARPGLSVLQVDSSTFEVYPWLVNLGAYEHRRFGFVLVDRTDQGGFTLRLGDLAPLGSPARLVTCPDFDIAEYPPGTAGYTRLNALVDRSLAVDLRRYD
jgi:hypothetical protein